MLFHRQGQGLRLKDQVVVGQHNAFGLPGGTRGVDQTGQRIRTDGSSPRGQAIREFGQLGTPRRTQIVPAHLGGTTGGTAHDDDVVHLVVAIGAADLGQLRLVLHQDGHRLAVGKDVLNLFTQSIGVQRHGAATRLEDGQVGQHPFEPGAGQQPHPSPQRQPQRQ